MKKVILAILVLAASAGSAFAQTNNDNKAPQAQEQRGDRKERMMPHYNPFEGINLTADQKSKIEALRAERKAEFEKAFADKQKAKADKMKAKAEKKAEKQKAKQDVRTKMKTERQKMLADIKAILTPDQYVKFLENNYLNAHKQGPRFDKNFKGPRDNRKFDGKRPKREAKKMKQNNK